MKKALLLLLVLTLVLVLASCKKQPINCAHIDINPADGICDFCEAEVEMPDDTDDENESGGTELPMLPVS